MQTKTVDVHEAQTHLVELLSLVTAGIEIILTVGILQTGFIETFEHVMLE
jgi:hypothetical protein